MHIVIRVDNSVVYFDFHLIGSYHSCSCVCSLHGWVKRHTDVYLQASHTEWKQIQFIMIYFLFYAWFRVRTYSEESECKLDLLDMFEWVQSYVQAMVVNGTTVRFSVYEMMLKNCGSTNTVSFKNVPVVGKNWFCVGFATEIVKCHSRPQWI